MKTERHDEHLSAELIQAFLDGEASPGEGARVRAHTSSCVSCRSELEAWSTLFGEIGAMAPLEPGPAFRERVLGAVHVPERRRVSLAARLAGWAGSTLRGVAGLPPAAPSHIHPGPERLQDFLEGLLPRGDALGVEGHLHACRDCRGEVEAWRSVFTGLGHMATFSPSPDFGERVMAHVRVQLSVAVARPGLKERATRAFAAVSPRTRRRMAAFAGAGVTPAALIGLVAWAVFSHPLATLGNLSAFVWLRVSDRFASLAAGGFARITESSLLLGLYQAMESLAGSPGTAALAVTGMGALSLSAAWVLYRNVLTGPSGNRIHVR